MATTTPTVGTDYTFTTYERVDFCTRPRHINNAYVFPRTATDFAPCDWTCYACHGTNKGTASVERVEKVARIDVFADNSTEVVTATGRRITHVAPHGDAC